VQIYNYNYLTWVSQKLIVPLTPLADNLSLYNSAIYDQNLMEILKWGGHYHGLINKGSTDGFRHYIIYNKTLFEAAGVKTPFEHWREGNWNWTQFKKTAKEMTTDSQYGFTGWGLGLGCASVPILNLNSVDMSVESNMESVLFERYLTELFDMYNISEICRSDWELQNWRALLPLNTDAMALGSLDNMQVMVSTANRKQTGADLRIAPAPVYDFMGDTDPRPYMYVLANAISSAAKAPVGAAEFLRLLSIVGQIQKAAHIEDGIDWMEEHFNAEEKAMMEWYTQLPVTTVFVDGVGDSTEIMSMISYAVMYPNDTPNVKSVIDTVKPLLEAEIDDFNARVKR
jgi:ABC-type glycerol-3-phosphate transport system substrate-binding protein